MILLCTQIPAQVFAAMVGNSDISSAGACVMDFETGEVLYEYNGSIKNDRILIPIRPLMETLEKTVEWDEEKMQTIISDETTTVCLTVGSGVMEKTTTNPLDGTVKTEEITLDAPPEIIGGRTCLPVRAVFEAFGAAVIWDADTATVLIIAGVC